MSDFTLSGTQDFEAPGLQLLYGEAFEVVPKIQTGPGLAVNPGGSLQFIRMRQGGPTVEMRLWSNREPFVQPTANLAYRGLVPLAEAALRIGETELLPNCDGMILLAATWPGARDDHAAFSFVMTYSERWGVVPRMIHLNEQHLWLDKTRDVRPMLTCSEDQWIAGR